MKAKLYLAIYFDFLDEQEDLVSLDEQEDFASLVEQEFLEHLCFSPNIEQADRPEVKTIPAIANLVDFKNKDFLFIILIK